MRTKITRAMVCQELAAGSFWRLFCFNAAGELMGIYHSLPKAAALEAAQRINGQEPQEAISAVS